MKGAGIGQEAQKVELAGAQAQQEVVANPSRLTATASRFCQCGPCLVERQAFREDGVATSSQQGDQTRVQWHALFVRKVVR